MKNTALLVLAWAWLLLASVQGQTYDHNIQTVATVSDLKDTSVVDGQIVATLGYEAAGDGGGNIYRFVAGDVSVCDAALIFDGPGGNNSGRSA